jgi:hypothetical protein
MIGIGTPRIQSRSPREKFMTILRVSEEAAFNSWDAQQERILMSET